MVCASGLYGVTVEVSSADETRLSFHVPAGSGWAALKSTSSV